MKLLRFIALVLAFSSILAHNTCAQEKQTNTQTAQQAPQESDKTGAQRHYDPLAGRQHLRGSLWDNALNSINPENRDYGECVSEWRRIAAMATIENFVFWVAILMSASLLLSLFFNYWLVHDRGRRLHISVEILAQISNAYIDARDHALDAIERHNKLADDYNVLAEKMATLEKQKTENAKRTKTTNESADPETAQPALDESSRTADDAAADTRLRTPSPLETETQVRQRFANQINALQEKNKNLRNSLNEALAQLEQATQQHGSARRG